MWQRNAFNGHFGGELKDRKMFWNQTFYRGQLERTIWTLKVQHDKDIKNRKVVLRPKNITANTSSQTGPINFMEEPISQFLRMSTKSDAGELFTLMNTEKSRNMYAK